MDNITFTNDVNSHLEQAWWRLGPTVTVIVTDSNVDTLVLPRLSLPEGAAKVVIPAGEAHKTLTRASRIWESFMGAGLKRGDLVINIGGGMVTDMGAFCASVFKRGVPFINIPTTLLGAVDASYGGKNGIDFNGTKNVIGAFASPAISIISASFLDTLPRAEVLSGYGEMLKHSLLDPAAPLPWDTDEDFLPLSDPDRMLGLIRNSVRVKLDIVSRDPTEKGLRKALNLGHTAGHAFEALALHKGHPVPHGYAVAWGLVTAMVLSRLRLGLSSGALYALATHVRETFGPLPVVCEDYPLLLDLMRADKKNTSPDAVTFTLLEDLGRPVTDVLIPEKDITPALDITCDLLK